MLEYFREIERTGKELIVTNHRKLVLKIIPLYHKPKITESIFKPYQHQIIYLEDRISPTIDEWTEV